MKVGSIVECIKKPQWSSVPTVITPVVGEKYMVRGIWRSEHKGKISLYLEEIHNKPLPFVNVEPSFESECFRELVPPDALEVLMEESVGETQKYEYEEL